MTRLAIGLALLILAVGLAALGLILARPRWRWERPDIDETGRELCREFTCWGDLDHDGPHLDAFGSPWTSTGSPPSVTTRADNGTAWSAVIGSPDDAARWAGG